MAAIRSFLALAFVGSAIAFPKTRSLHKRAAPAIGSGFSDQEMQQLNGAFNDALLLAHVSLGDGSGDSSPDIFAKYFDPTAASDVNAVFLNILGGDASNPVGNDLLSQITIVQDYPDANRGVLACDGATMAEMRAYDTANPVIIVCPGAGFGHGGIDAGFGSVPAVTCDSLDPRVSWKMETLGSILLHEYTHFTQLVSPPLTKETDDEAYGPYECREYDKGQAKLNADSYSWFANENFWSDLCDTTYEDPTEADSDDPNCGGTVCKAPKSNP